MHYDGGVKFYMVLFPYQMIFIENGYERYEAKRQFRNQIFLLQKSIKQ